MNATAVLEYIGFIEDTYDCWMNHFTWNSWVELEQYGINALFVTISWD